MPPILSILSLRNILLGVGIFAAIFAVIIFAKPDLLNSLKGAQPGAKGDVTMWGTLPENEMNNILQSFNPQAKTYAVRYSYVSEATFEQKLLEALASGNGPDLILTRYQTILSQAPRILPFSVQEKPFKDKYVDGASVLYTESGALALPVSVEPMVLFYNRTLLSKHGIVNPPTTWDEVSAVTPELTIRNGSKFVETSIALGAPDVPYMKDITMSVVRQLGQAPVIRVPLQGGGAYYNVTANDPVTSGSEVYPLAATNGFLTQFGDSGQKSFSWNGSLGNATDAFVGEKLAMYIGYSGELNTLRARNPRADINMSFFPQTKGYTTFETGMRMYAVATLKSTKNPLTALTVELQFSDAGVSPSLAGVVGGRSALRTEASAQGLDPVIAKSMLIAKGWYDSHEKESTAYASTMISDIINYRYGVSDASNVFIGRMRDVYSR